MNISFPQLEATGILLKLNADNSTDLATSGDWRGQGIANTLSVGREKKGIELNYDGVVVKVDYYFF